MDEILLEQVGTSDLFLILVLATLVKVMKLQNDLVGKCILSPCTGSVALIKLNPMHKKGHNVQVRVQVILTDLTRQMAIEGHLNCPLV